MGSMRTLAEGPFDARAGDRISNPIEPRSPLERGRRLYSTYCVPCHGETGTGRDGAVAKHLPSVGDLTSPEVQQHGDGWLYAIITAGTKTMPAYAHELEPHERWQIIAFVRTLPK